MRSTTIARSAAMICACSLLVACSPQSAIEEAVRQRLKDPESARFGEFYHNAKTDKVCIMVNAKNSMGGYTGESPVGVWKSDGEWVAVDKDDLDIETCRKWADQVD